jgi:alpha-ketoglutarate-dependent taurine dioxygenase
MAMATLVGEPASALSLAPLLPGGGLPLKISPEQPGAPLSSLARELRGLVERYLHEHGGLLFRGFGVAGVDDFRAFAASFGHPLLTYDFGSTPRSRVTEGVYSSTEYPAHQSIPLHNEQAYSREWPMKIWFYCALPSIGGGETPIADSREVYARIPAQVRQRWEQRGLMYVRNFGGGLDVPWPQVFNTTDRAEVESYCRAHGISCEWKPDGELRTRQVCQVVAQHPHTRQWVWFNQAHLFHVSGLEEEVREVLLDAVAPEDLPRNVYHADGSELPADDLAAIRGVLGECQRVFPWQAGDVLMLDNMLAAHARNPFSGPRKVVVAMAEAHSAFANVAQR